MSAGVLFAVDGLTVERIKNMAVGERPTYISETLEELYFEEYPERTCELEEAWDAMHRAFTDGSLCFDCEQFPLGSAILGGERLYFDGDRYADYIITAKSPELTAKIYERLEALTEKEFKKGYGKIDPEEYADKGKEDFEQTLEILRDSTAFWRFAAQHGLWTLFTAEVD
jgi:hypothetical protein